jgi:DNA-binding transcriptional ArsR family regulator
MQTRSKSLSNLFRAAGGEIRVSILSMLVTGPQDLGTIIRKLKRSPSLIAHHLKVLYAAGWVTRSKFGKLVTYYINEKAVKEVVSFFKKS